jgi:hypothetical protein
LDFPVKGKRGSINVEYFSNVAMLRKPAMHGFAGYGTKLRLNKPGYFGRIRALLKSVGVVSWHEYVK